MHVSLPSELQRFVDEQLASGTYATTEDVLQAAVALLRQSERFGDFAAGELDGLLAEGERMLENQAPIEGEVVFNQLRHRSNEHRGRGA